MTIVLSIFLSICNHGSKTSDFLPDFPIYIYIHCMFPCVCIYIYIMGGNRIELPSWFHILRPVVTWGFPMTFEKNNTHKHIAYPYYNPMIIPFVFHLYLMTISDNLIISDYIRLYLPKPTTATCWTCSPRLAAFQHLGDAALVQLRQVLRDEIHLES